MNDCSYAKNKKHGVKSGKADMQRKTLLANRP